MNPSTPSSKLHPAERCQLVAEDGRSTSMSLFHAVSALLLQIQAPAQSTGRVIRLLDSEGQTELLRWDGRSFQGLPELCALEPEFRALLARPAA